MSHTHSQDWIWEHELARGVTARIVRAKIRRLIGHGRFVRSDAEDLRQELAIEVLEASASFDPAAGPWDAFVATVVERKSAQLLKRRKAEKREYRHHVVSLSSLVHDEEGHLVPLASVVGEEHREPFTGRYRSSDQERVEIAEGLPVVLARLTPLQQQLCRGLKQRTLNEVAHEQGIPRRTLRDEAVLVAREFARHGF